MTTPVPQVPSADAEAASALLFRTLGAHRSAVAALKPRPRPRLRTAPDGDPIQDRCQATLVRLLSITEAFASDMLSREVDRSVVGTGNATATKVADEAVIRGTSSWQDQQKSYKDWLGVREDWKAVERLAEARNAVAHGLGKLTRRQMRSENSVKSKLKAAGITVEDNRIVLSDDSLAAAASACRDFIERLDLAVQARA
ncbi:hypothetical protein [Micromonospora fulviviridis]|uniref:RiboL-PSP-HEPN domain-containing protein n=1 Tax=Micromonospora fulviviridis TaxID=47860 RepID=A0ABV2VHU1_9ACTN